MDQDMDARSAAWSSYWKSGALHSCASSYQGNYEGAISGFWSAVFGGLGPGSRILDIATGNGALPKLLADGFGSAGHRIDAIDYSELAPAWYRPEQYGSIRFFPNVAMEALPFADAHFDAVVSQYGFEYGRRADALAECLRVSKRTATIALVMHHADGILVRIAGAEVANADHLLEAGGLFETADGVIRWLETIAGDPSMRSDARALQCRDAYNKAMSDLGEAIRQSPVADLLLEARDRVHALVSAVRTIGADATLALLDAYRIALLEARLRSVEMMQGALDEAQIREIKACLLGARPDLLVRCNPLSQHEGVIGWALFASPRHE